MAVAQLGLYAALGIVVVRILARPVADPPAWTPVPPSARDRHGMAEPLTERELEVLRIAATGESVAGIADLLFLSPNTVKTHLSHAYSKLGAPNRSGAVRAALNCGCLTSSDICPYPPRPPTREAPERVT